MDEQDKVAEIVVKLRTSNALEDGGPDACELGQEAADLVEALAKSLTELERVRREALNRGIERAAVKADELYMIGEMKLPGVAIRAMKEKKE